MLLVCIFSFLPRPIPPFVGCVLSLGGSGLGSGFTLPIAISSEEESEPKVLTFLEEKVSPFGEGRRTVKLILILVFLISLIL